MSAVSRWIQRMLKPLRSGSVTRAMDDEMRFHIEMETAMLVGEGVPLDEARRRALAGFGGMTRFKEEARDAWPLRWAGEIWADVRFALRSLRSSPSFTVAATIALALGMGANTIVFSAVDSVAFRPLAVHAPDRVVALYGRQGDAGLLAFSYATFRDLRRDASAFSDLAAVTEGPVILGAAEPTTVWAAHVSDNYFSMLGVEPAVGALIRPGELAMPVVVLSHQFWTRRFASNPNIVGQTIRINGSAFTVAGIAPEQFTGTRLFTYEPSVWLPAGMFRQTIPASGDLLVDRAASRFLIVGRLNDGVTLSQARQSADAAARRLAESFPEYRGFGIQVISNRTPINPWLAPPERIVLIGRLLVLGISLVLLVACANIASLLLARMSARGEEISVRLSLGASRRRILQQLLTESVVLAALGAVAAIPVTMLGAMLVRMISPHLDYASSWRPADGGRMIAFSLGLTVGAALLFGLAPALRTIRRSVGVGVRPPTAIGPKGRVRLHFREMILVGQVAVSVVVLAVAALFMRSLREARSLDTGFAMDGAVSFTLDPRLDPAYDAARTQATYSRILSRLRELPGVAAASRVMFAPLDGNSSVRRVFADGGTVPPEHAPGAEFNLSAPEYFRAIGTPIVAGRDFVPADSAATTDVAIINDVLARRLWPNDSPIGKRIRFDSAAGPAAEIVGVARASNYRTPGEMPRPAVWRDLDRVSRSRTTIVVRTTRDDAAIFPEIRGVVRETDPGLPVIGLASLRDHLSFAYAAVESGAIGALSFGLLAALLTAAGICGVVAYGVSQRRREIGIRVALGARSGAVVRLVVARTILLTSVGVAAGLAVVALVPMGIDAMLYHVSRHDPVTLALAAAAFCALAAVAALIPAVRAVRVDPVQVLRLT